MNIFAESILRAFDPDIYDAVVSRQNFGVYFP